MATRRAMAVAVAVAIWMGATACSIAEEDAGDKLAQRGEYSEAIAKYQLATGHVTPGSDEARRISLKSALVGESLGDDHLAGKQFAKAADAYRGAASAASRAGATADAERIAGKLQPIIGYQSAIARATRALESKELSQAGEILAGIDAQFRRTAEVVRIEMDIRTASADAEQKAEAANALQLDAKWAEALVAWDTVAAVWADMPGLDAKRKVCTDWLEFRRHMGAATAALGTGDIPAARAELAAAEQLHRTEETVRLAATIAVADAYREFKAAMAEGLNRENAGDWYAAKLAYQRAAKAAGPAKLDAAPATDRIVVCNANLVAKFDAAMKAGSDAASGESWHAAAVAFEAAVTFATQADIDVEAATSQLAGANQQLAVQAYRTAMNAGQAAEDGARWNEAMQIYESAIVLAKTARLEDETAVRKRDAMRHVLGRQIYDAAANRARAAEVAENWPAAAQAWEAAISAAPNAGMNPAEATAQLAQARKMIAWRAYREYLANAREAESTGDFEAAATWFAKASDNAPPAGVDVGESQAAARRARAMATYADYVEKATAARAAKNFAAARTACDAAIRVAIESTLFSPSAAREIWHGIETDLAADYQRAVQAANDAEIDGKWTDAATHWARAESIADISRDIASTTPVANKARATARDEFSQAMANAQRAETVKSWERALQFYQAAVRLAGPAGWDAPGERGGAAREGCTRVIACRDYWAAMMRAEQHAQNFEFNRALTAYREAADLATTAGYSPQEANAASIRVANQEQYVSAMQTGINAVKGGDWVAAVAAFRDAVRFANLAGVPVTEAQTALHRTDAQRNFDSAMTRGRQAEASLKWAEAITAYQEAARVERAADQKPGTAQAAITRVTAQQNYWAGMKRGETAMLRNAWGEAAKAFREAAAIAAQAEFNPIEAETAAAKAHAREQFEASLDAARKALVAGKFAAATIAYRQAAAYARDCEIDPAQPIREFHDRSDAAAKAAERRQHWHLANAVWRLAMVLAQELKIDERAARAGMARTQAEIDKLEKLAAAAEAAAEAARKAADAPTNEPPSDPASPGESNGSANPPATDGSGGGDTGAAGQ